MANALVRTNLVTAPGAALPNSDFDIGLIGYTAASVADGNIPTGAVVPGAGDLRSVSNIKQARDLYGWLHDDPQLTNSNTYSIPAGTLPRDLEGIYANVTDHVVVSPYVKGSDAAATTTNMVNALKAFESSNRTGRTIEIICFSIPSAFNTLFTDTQIQQVWAQAVTTAANIKAALVCASLPDTTVSLLVSAAAQAGYQHKGLARSHKIIPTPFSTLDDGTTAITAANGYDSAAFMAGALCREWQTGGVHANPFHFAVRGVSGTVPVIGFSYDSASDDAATLRSHNVIPIVSDEGAFRIGYNVTAVQDSSVDPDRFINTYAQAVELEKGLGRALRPILRDNVTPQNIDYALAVGDAYLAHTRGIQDHTLELAGSSAEISQGHITFDASYEPIPPVGRITLNIEAKPFSL